MLNTDLFNALSDSMLFIKFKQQLATEFSGTVSLKGCALKWLMLQTCKLQVG